MSDIVKELRLLGETAATLEQAADEIERLRANYERLEQSVLAWIDSYGDLRTEYDRLEACVAAARREGIEAAWGVVADEPVQERELAFHEVMQRDERMMAAIRALLKENEG